MSNSNPSSFPAGNTCARPPAREARQHIQPGDDPAIGLDGLDISLDFGDQIGEQLRFKRVDSLFGSEDLFLIDLQFFGDVPFGADQRLLADPLRRDLIFEGIADFDVVAENVVEADFEK